MISKLIILIGALLKVIDDYYDMNIFSDTVGIIAQALLVCLSLYLFTKDRAFLLMTVITCVYIWFAEGQMEDSKGETVIFYYIYNTISFAFFGYYLVKEGYNDLFSKITLIEYVRLFLFFLFIYYENKMVPEDLSRRKIIIRTIIVALAILYICYEESQEEKTIVIRDIYLLAIGYMGTSIVNMLYAYYDQGHHPPLLE
jgi:hypothetical protein